MHGMMHKVNRPANYQQNTGHIKLNGKGNIQLWLTK